MYGSGGHYRAWAEFLDRWQAGEQPEPGRLPQLGPEDFAGESWERLANRLTGALSRQLQSWADALTRAMAGARDEFGVARALGHARWGLRSIREVAGHPGLPEALREQLLAAVDRQVRSAQASLEAQVEQLRRDGVERRLVEARLRTLRDNPLTSAVPGASAPPGAAWSSDPTAPRSRRVIVD